MAKALETATKAESEANMKEAVLRGTVLCLSKKLTSYGERHGRGEGEEEKGKEEGGGGGGGRGRIQMCFFCVTFHIFTADLHSLACLLGAECRRYVDDSCTHYVGQSKGTGDKEWKAAKDRGCYLVSPHWVFEVSVNRFAQL